jgi:hypothetical protein
MKQKNYLLFLFPLLVLSLIYCSSEENSIKIYEENDVIIVLNPEQPIYPNAKFIFEEELCIGEDVDDTTQILFRVRDIKVDSDDNIYVLDNGEFRFKVFDKEGNYKFSFGKKGEGPGEFLRTLSFCLGSDKQIYVLDYQTKRISILDKFGNYISGFNFRDITGKFYLVDQFLFFSKSIKDNLKPDFLQIGKYTTNGELLVNLGKYQDMIYQIVESKRGQIGINTGLESQTIWAIDNLGNLYTGFNDTYEINIVSDENKVMRTIHKKWIPLETEEEYIRKFNASYRRMEVKGVKFPKFKPVFKSFTFDERDQLWVELYTKYGEDEFLFDIFDKNGKYLYQVKLPFLPREFKDNKIYTIERTEDDIEVVKKYNYYWRIGDE